MLCVVPHDCDHEHIHPDYNSKQPVELTVDHDAPEDRGCEYEYHANRCYCVCDFFPKYSPEKRIKYDDYNAKRSYSLERTQEC